MLWLCFKPLYKPRKKHFQQRNEDFSSEIRLVINIEKLILYLTTPTARYTVLVLDLFLHLFARQRFYRGTP